MDIPCIINSAKDLKIFQLASLPKSAKITNQAVEKKISIKNLIKCNILLNGYFSSDLSIKQEKR